MTQRGFAPILIILLVATLAGLVLLVPFPYYQYAYCNEMDPPQCSSAGWKLKSPLWQEILGVPRQTASHTLTPPTPIPTPQDSTSSAETANWKTYTIKTLGLQFKLPPQISRLGDLKEEEELGQICIKLSRKTVKLIGDVYAGGGCLSDNSQWLKIGITSSNPKFERMLGFTDYQGFKIVNGKYYMKFLDKLHEIPSEYGGKPLPTQEIKNLYGVQILKVISTCSTSVPGYEGECVPFAGLREGWIGALINTNNVTYPGLALEVEIGPDVTEETFNQILSTFRFE